MNHINGWPEWGVISPTGKLFNAKKAKPNKTVIERNKHYVNQNKHYVNQAYTHSDAVIQASRNKAKVGNAYLGDEHGWIRWYSDVKGHVYFEDAKHQKESSKQRINRVEKILHKGGIEFHTVIDDKGKY